MELFSQEYFEHVVRRAMPADSPDPIIKKSASDLQRCLGMGYKDGLTGCPMQPHKRDKNLTRAQQRYAKSLFEVYKLGYQLGKAAM